MKKEIFLSLIISFIFLTGLVWADNEVWNNAEDIIFGTFGSDEQPDTTNYTFISDVEFADTISVKSNNIIESKSDSSYYVDLNGDSSLNKLVVDTIYAGNPNGNFKIIN